MSDFESYNNRRKHTECGKTKDENIIAFNILDQCRVQECINQGPVVSEEKCTCILLQADEEDRFGRVILPGCPIYMPEMACKVKVKSGSFQTKNIEILSIIPSKVKSGYWDVDIRFTFVFKLQLFDMNMHIMKILCCEPDSHSLRDCKHMKDYITGSVCYEKTVTLFGSEGDAPLIASDIFPFMDTPAKNSPHVLVESKAYFVDVALKSPEDACHYKEVLDDIYDEPTIYIYITIGVFMLIRLFRLTSILIESKGYSIARPCDCGNTDPCDILSEMKFPMNDFLPGLEE